MPPVLADRVTSELIQHGIEVECGRLVHLLDRSKPGEPVRLHTQKLGSDDRNDVIEADHVVVAIGTRPDLKFAEDAQLEIDDKRGGLVS